MKWLGKWLLRYKTFILGVLAPLGFWGAGLVAAVDSGTIPVPMDVLIATYVWNDRRHFYLYVLMAAIGSAVGGLVPFLLGRAGGELFLLRRIDRARYEAMMARFEKQEFLAMAIPSALPPPTPWKAFAFGAGVFEMPIWLFMLSVFTGRLVRFGIEAVLVIRYGPEIVNVAGSLFKHHLDATLGTLGVVLIALVIWGMRRASRRRREKLANAEGSAGAPPSADRNDV